MIFFSFDQQIKSIFLYLGALFSDYPGFFIYLHECFCDPNFHLKSNHIKSKLSLKMILQSQKDFLVLAKYFLMIASFLCDCL